MNDTAPVRGAASGNDRDLLVRAQGGDPAAFEVAMADRLDGLWRPARALLGTDEAAGDAVSVVVLAAWRELPRLEDLDRFDAWLDRILLSECRMRLAATGGDGAPSPVPADLLAGAMARVREAPPRPPRPQARRRRADPVPWIVLALGLVAIVTVTAVAASLLRMSPGAGAAVTATSTPTATAQSSAPLDDPPPGSADATPAPNADLRVGGLAIVPFKGQNLRVRTAPGTDKSSTMLNPLLPAGTRMLVVGGPVEANGLRWWEVRTDSEVLDPMFGWVADGRDDEVWLAPAEARCVGDPDATAATGMSRIDFLACYGSIEVSFEADAATLWDAREIAGDCGWVRKRDGCAVDSAWLLLPSTVVKVKTDPDTQHDLVVAMPPDLAAQLALLPRHRTLRLTVAMDSPDARGCRIRSAKTGKLLLPHDGAVTECRLQFVVQEVAFRQ